MKRVFIHRILFTSRKIQYVKILLEQCLFFLFLFFLIFPACLNYYIAAAFYLNTPHEARKTSHFCISPYNSRVEIIHLPFSFITFIPFNPTIMISHMNISPIKHLNEGNHLLKIINSLFQSTR